MTISGTATWGRSTSVRAARHRRDRVASIAAGIGLFGLSVLIGAAAATNPLFVLVPLGAIALVTLAFRAPVTHLTLLLLTTLVVGYVVQHKLGSHLLPSDALLLTGLLRASVVMMRQRLDARRLAVVALMAALCVATLLQVIHGLQVGHSSSQVGDEARDLLGFGSLLIATPILSDVEGRRRVGAGLIVVGLILGAWGLATWALGISFGEQADIGVRSSTDIVASGAGQLHGGLYGYPVAVLMSAAMLLSGAVKRPLVRWCLVVVLDLNLVALALTYERTFWVTTAVTLGFVVVKMGSGRRLRAAVTVLASAVAVVGVLATVSPTTFSKLEARVLTLGQGIQDDSVRYRVVETGLVLDKARAKPLIGWGLGDTLYWGQPWHQVPARATWFSHNGYLWVIWKTGVLQAAILFGLVAWAIGLRAPPESDSALRSLRVGAQGGLLALALATTAFPSFNSITITAVMGVLMAVCFMPRTTTSSGPSGELPNGVWVGSGRTLRSDRAGDFGWTNADRVSFAMGEPSRPFAPRAVRPAVSLDMPVRLSYGVITPTRNEEENLARLGSSMTGQNLEPRRWIIVDNGSTDGTASVARQLADEHPWITLLEIPGEATPVRGAPIVRAFHAGIEALEEHVDAVVKLDADVSFDPDFFERMMGAFDRDPSLGITGGICVERNAGGSWVECHVTRDHVRGATRAYRWECLQDVLPLEERIGWDGVDELKAQVRGWHTRTLQDARFYHHRRLGGRESTWGMWLLQGDMAHFMCYRPYYVLARTLYRSLRQPSAVAMLWGYGTAAAAGRPRCTDATAVARLRRQQSVTALPRRIREALGQSA